MLEKKISIKDLTAYYGDKKIQINPWIISTKGLDAETVKMILNSHADLLETEYLMGKTDVTDLALLKEYANNISVIKSRQQELWGFKLNTYFHEFWRLPHCTCDKKYNENQYIFLLNNNDYIPKYKKSDSCPVHKE